MLDAEIKELKSNLNDMFQSDLAKLLNMKHIAGVFLTWDSTYLDTVGIHFTFTLTLNYGKKNHKVYLTINNYVIIPTLCKDIDEKAGIPNHGISNLDRARLRILWVIHQALTHFKNTYEDRWGSGIYEWEKLKKYKDIIITVVRDTARLNYEYK